MSTAENKKYFQAADPLAGVPLQDVRKDGQCVEKTDAEWREELTPEEFRVLRQAGTERPYTGEYWDTHTAGMYQCRACGA
jgi:peptide-methionine (R)-S-oxide reductase